MRCCFYYIKLLVDHHISGMLAIKKIEQIYVRQLMCDLFLHILLREMNTVNPNFFFLPLSRPCTE